MDFPFTFWTCWSISNIFFYKINRSVYSFLVFLPWINTSVKILLTFLLNSNNRLYNVQPVVGLGQYNFSVKRRAEIVLARAQIGHIYSTHFYLLKGKSMPECFPCDCKMDFPIVFDMLIHLKYFFLLNRSVCSLFASW